MMIPKWLKSFLFSEDKSVKITVFRIVGENRIVKEKCKLENEIICKNTRYPADNIILDVRNKELYAIVSDYNKTIKLTTSGFSELINTAILENGVVRAFERIYEKPPIWWQWLMLMLFGAMGGVGLGFFLGLYLMH